MQTSMRIIWNTATRRRVMAALGLALALGVLGRAQAADQSPSQVVDGLAPSAGRAEHHVELVLERGLADELGSHREKPGDRARNVGRRHAGAAVLRVVACLVAGMLLRVGLQAPPGAGDDLFARRDEIGFRTAVAGRPLRRKVRHTIHVGHFTMC